MTERDAAQALEADLRRRGVHDWFHVPLAWFGERSSFQNMKGFRDYLPSTRKLEKGDVVILDIAPIVDGYIGDVGYTLCLDENPKFERVRASLSKLRLSIPNLFKSEKTLGEIWQEVEKNLLSEGYQNAYARYPFSVLGHRVPHVAGRRKFRNLVPFSFMSWFGMSAYLAFLKGGIASQLIRKNSSQSKLGLWAIEPHLGADGFGAKFEEILVVEPNKAFWLDDQVPHR